MPLDNVCLSLNERYSNALGIFLNHEKEKYVVSSGKGKWSKNNPMNWKKRPHDKDSLFILIHIKVSHRIG